MIEDTWGIDDLPPGVLVVGVTHEQTLSSEGIWLHINIGISHVVHETGLTNVRVTSDNQCSCIRVDLRKTSHVLTDLLQIAQRRLQLFQQCAYTTERSFLELLGTVESIGVLQQSHVIIGDVVNDGLGLVDVPECELVVILIVENVHEIGIEGVNVVQFREPINDARELLVD